MNFPRIATILITLVLAACSGETGPANGAGLPGDRRPIVVTGNYPLYYFAREIAGDAAEVVLPEIDGDPANWKPGRDDIASMQAADLLILNGAGYGDWLGWVSLPQDRILDTTAGIGERLIPLKEEAVHQHGPAGQHSHQGVAFTVWLDPSLAAEQAKAIEASLARLLPDDTQALDDNLAALLNRLETLEKSLHNTFENVGDQPLIFSHPVYQYLAARYGLNGVSVHWEPGEEPGTTMWVEFGRILQEHPARLMIWEDEPLESTANKLRELGVEPVVFDTASNIPGRGDYFEVMENNVDRLLLSCCPTTIETR